MAVAWLIWPLMLSLTALSANSLTEAESLLKFKESLTNTKSLDSWTLDTEPCGGTQRWSGLLCNKNSVFGLKIEQMGLTGNIDVAPLLDLPGLRTISIMNNSFSGKIPEFNRLTALKSIYLSNNRFSGDIPSDYFARMLSLKKVWLSNNEFTGHIPLSLATTLPRLMELHLENNQFTGIIPNFTQPGLADVNLSNNRLTGEIPPGLSRFKANNFAGNPDLCGEKLATTCTQPGISTASISADGDTKDEYKSKYYIAFGTLGLLFILIIFFFFFLKKRRETTLGTSEQDNTDDQQIQVTIEGPRTGGSTGGGSRHCKPNSFRELRTDLVMVNKEKGVFDLEELLKSSAHALGPPDGRPATTTSGGSVGSAYKAVIASGVKVVVKRVTVMNEVSIGVFAQEIKNLGSLRHKNILTPLAYHSRRDEKLLVFEFIPNLSLLHRLRGSQDSNLDWPSRLKIIQGIARGMCYLHRELSFLTLPHGNLKSSNVFLADDGEPLISEFGFQRLINPDAQSQSLAAYDSRDGTVSAKSDVFSFGAVVLEILTGKSPPSEYGGLDPNLAEWMDLLDPTVVTAARDDRMVWDEIETVLGIGVRCIGGDPDRRPSMVDVVDELTMDDFVSVET
ncbi:Leucine-rich repeat protein kinase family protein [Hirschfeldia incana]|nr:Leucine-rich repeat protein kinase family protein [Hirschfeldia incana]